MDVQTQPREARIFSILNDNDCPSFVIPLRQSSPAPSTSAASSSTPASPRQQKGRRPSLLRQAQYCRTSSFSSAGSPPLLRQSSSSSKSSNSSMDSSPSPVTPAYNYLDNNVLSYDALLRQDLVGPIPSPTTITPFLEQQLMISPDMPDQFSSKQIPSMMPAQYPLVPAPLQPGPAHLPSVTSASAPVPLTTSAPSIQTRDSPSATSPGSVKKNKYPCPYAQSHNCQASFTTSGHAARHGKKHTGEKGVHCPICNKAFTRKDNMKQHERTHKNLATGGSNGNDLAGRSKAAITKEAQKTKQVRTTETMASNASRRSSMIHSPLSEVTSLAPTAIETPLNLEETNFYSQSPQMLMPIQNMQDGVSPNTIYPPMGVEMLLANDTNLQQTSLHKMSGNGLGNHGLMPPTLVRGYSDLDTLAQAAESFDPYYQQGM
ncbi:hypothetical protein A1O3_09974 [Capronia epimyces CBS 606.96]|uniref:C2H2-type domain-containing protein n=1 Tax=Capronia epimyces CBS 606.96 TaxID=1182542 RepID=W9XK61_9EURO|nr:uncharacterized protein A1O3_09974 [Capronia epimyces CBS 606.96]EXJ77745.1 hypothetical protein A1O3_09974 [Capronia epimyces CBS 606.96]